MNIEVQSSRKGRTYHTTFHSAITEFNSDKDAHTILCVLPSGELLKLFSKQHFSITSGGLDIITR